MAKTLLVDLDHWDLVIGLDGNIAVAAEPYALAQDAASAIKLFAGELWYDTSKGVPYFAQILGRMPPLALIKAAMLKAALSVPSVTQARCFVSSIDNNRVVHGQVQVTAAGQTAAAGF